MILKKQKCSDEALKVCVFTGRGVLICKVFVFTSWSFSSFDSAHVKLHLIFKGIHFAFLLLLNPV